MSNFEVRLNEVGSNPKCIKFKSLDKFVWRLQVVFLDNIYVRRINKISRLRCRTIIIGYRWFGLSLLFFLFNENTNYTGQQKNSFFKQEQEHSFLGNIEALIPNLALVFF